ncbi:nucleoside triphosphate pyrophosphohydrolase [Alkalimarinus alittae]|uniref:Nucleoside triphosphate pyrophosphohydrolase n=1 Tax=Alkalimarinus alittae TaxID=2961619 RepID=A0ABY6N4T6_9ALTE|nr:nucleoside triphosphate pyrophosphohydrolase [Alkalimarinus alittae]UZE97128.1 nucleoside triphosphate pyrophosphohydrolase [Alkalimarinus alittae]
MSERYGIEDLLYLMNRLRDPEKGCPWDIKQTFDSILPHTLEEAYEVADAIEKKDYEHLKDELGDLLFQVIFYAQMGKESAYFDFSDIVSNLVTKLVRRHPHVFPDGTLVSELADGETISEAEIKQNWERIKAEERALKAKKEALIALEKKRKEAPFTSVLDDIPANLPSLARAEKLQKRAAHYAFDWPSVEPVFDKIQEELKELKDVLAHPESDAIMQQQHLIDEMGDVLFCCVNLARVIKVNSDTALRSTNQKFINRFQYIEKSLLQQGKVLGDVPLDELDALWDEAKGSFQKPLTRSLS